MGRSVTDNSVKTGLGAAALAAVLLIMAAFSHSWLIGNDFGIEARVGLRTVDSCETETDGDTDCESVALSSWADSAYAPKGLGTYITLATLSFFTSLATAFFMLILLGYGALKKAPRWPVHPGSISLILSMALLVVGVLTLALHPFKTTGWGTGPGFLLLGAGDVAALVAALFLGRSVPVTEEEWFE